MTNNTSPIFVAGRQHSGNTMLTSVLGRHPSVHAFRNEDRFFEHIDRFQSPPTEEDLDRLTDILADGDLPSLSRQERQSIRSWLQEQVKESDYDTTAYSLYRRAKNKLTSCEGKQRWAQKATSYIFYIESLLRRMPNANIIFLIRNPFDIAASLRIRESASYWLRMCIGWRKGVQRARKVEMDHPENVLVIRYEDLVQSPKSQVAHIFQHCGLTFDDRVLSVEKVNPAERPYEDSNRQTGISDEKVGYYRKHLSQPEQSAVATLAGLDTVQKEYPEISHHRSEVNLPSWLVSTTSLSARGMGHIISDVLRRSASDPQGTLLRFWHRLRN